MIPFEYSGPVPCEPTRPEVEEPYSRDSRVILPISAKGTQLVTAQDTPFAAIATIANFQLSVIDMTSIKSAEIARPDDQRMRRVDQ